MADKYQSLLPPRLRCSHPRKPHVTSLGAVTRLENAAKAGEIQGNLITFLEFQRSSSCFLLSLPSWEDGSVDDLAPWGQTA